MYRIVWILHRARRENEVQPPGYQLQPEEPQGALYSAVEWAQIFVPSTMYGSVSVRKDDEVHVIRGTYKGREGKVLQVYRKKSVIHIEHITREKVSGATVNIGVDPSKGS